MNDEDELWCRLKNIHCVEAYEAVNAEVAKIISSSKADTEGMSITDMTELMRKLPKNEEMLKNYKVHMELLNKVLTSITASRTMKIVDLEQNIISGLDPQLDGKKKPISNVALVKAISQISKELNPRDYLRILMIYFVCYDLRSGDKQTMLKSFQKESYREILQNLELLDASKAAAN